MEATFEYVSAACNCTYNCMELTETFVLFGSHKALAIYDLMDEKVTSTYFGHKGRINCVRFVKNIENRSKYVTTCCAGGGLTLWKEVEYSPEFKYAPIIQRSDERCNTVCCGIQNDGNIIIGCISTQSQISIYVADMSGSELKQIQEIFLNRSLSNDLVFHAFQDGSIVLALGMDNGSVVLYDQKDNSFVPTLTLQKHEDWVRCIDFVTLENGDTLMASGGQDSFIAVWKFTKSKSSQSSFEFQVHQYKDYNVIFDSMIIGHEGWINSLTWNVHGELLSCSSDQSIILWENLGDIWMEKARLGVTGGMIPGGCCAKYFGNNVISSGFQGAVQIWNSGEDGDWELRPSITGHFLPISDMDYEQNGNYIVTTSEDQTTRIHAPWGSNRWHEISRPQIHGHDLFACKTIGEMIVSGAEEKILRAFQPTEVFYKNLEDASGIVLKHKDAAKAAFLPTLGLSNQTEDTQINPTAFELPIETRLDEDFIRSQTLWLEVSKLYGHVYEIACIATSPVDSLVASASQATKQQFAAIILWCAKRWKNLGEFPHHKLNITGMEFSPDGSKLLSVSRDRTWVVWKVIKPTNTNEPIDFRIEVVDTGAVHTRALWVGTWGPNSDYFVTGARDKKLIVWNRDSNEKYQTSITQTFSTSVSGAAVNSGNQIAVGLETGEIQVFQLENSCELKTLLKLDNSQAHHDTVKRLRFNPKKSTQLASAGADHILKVYNLLKK